VERRRRNIDGDGDGNGEDPPALKHLKVEDSGGNVLRFACPYRKHDPRQYSILPYTACAKANWGTISRLKYQFQIIHNLKRNLLQAFREHLYRCHLALIHCKRCRKKFKVEVELDQHLMLKNEEIC
jgi:hypothetical protein